MTQKQFEKRMAEVAQDLKADGKEIEEVAFDVADNLWWDSEIRKFAEKHLAPAPWDVRKLTKLEVVTFIAESINI